MEIGEKGRGALDEGVLEEMMGRDVSKKDNFRRSLGEQNKGGEAAISRTR